MDPRSQVPSSPLTWLSMNLWGSHIYRQKHSLSLLTARDADVDGLVQSLRRLSFVLLLFSDLPSAYAQSLVSETSTAAQSSELTQSTDAPQSSVSEENADVTSLAGSGSSALSKTLTSTTNPSADPSTLAPEQQISEAEYQPLSPPTAEEVESTDSPEAWSAQFVRELQYYEKGAYAFFEGQRSLIQSRYTEEKDAINSRYENRIESLEVEERSRRQEAIERFEGFLKKYPDNRAYTPDAMFRLAELHFEKSSDDYLRESRAHEEALMTAGYEEELNLPPPPEPNYDKTISLHKQLLERFEDYRLADAARYLLGYAYSEMDQIDEALVAFEELVRYHPTSSFLPEVWTRIGEIYFDGSSVDDLQKAIFAYQNVLNAPSSAFYDKALYKVAWAFYRLDRYDDSVRAFIELVRYADEQKEKTGISGSELRSEAIQYIAISLADENWGGYNKALAKLRPLEKEALGEDIWHRYGEVLYDQTRYQEAVKALEYMLARYPDAPGNPEAQAQIIRAHEQMRDFDSATVAREVLVKKYSLDSEWAKANANDDKALKNAQALTDRALYTAALFRHQQAQSLRSQGDEVASKRQYKAAAAAYQNYLERFPDSDRGYDFRFYLAETLYYSDDYELASEAYAVVRDSKLSDKHLQAAALYCVIAQEKFIEQLELRGKLTTLKVLKAEERENRPVNPLSIPPERQKLISASDRYLSLVTKAQNRPAVAYRAAQEYYKLDRFPEARERFEQIIAQYPDHAVAEFSANLVIESYLVVEEWDKVDEWSGRIIEIAQRSKEQGTRGKSLVSALEDVRLRAQFKLAERLNSQNQYEEAAAAYVKLVDANPESNVADKALFNAAVAFEKANRFDTASKIYQRISDDYPGSDLASRSLFRVGINAEKGFDFPAAITAYSALVKNYPKADENADALFNVGVVLEHMQRYEDAARTFKRYAKTYKSRADAGDVYFRSALVYEKFKSWDRMISTLNDFVKVYRNAPQQRERIVRAHKKIGEAEQNRKRSRVARDAYEQCVKAFKRLRLKVESRAGGYAAECAFELAEFVFRAYDEISIRGSERQQVTALRKKATVQVKAQEAYSKVFQYKRLEQTIAASYRIGHTYDRFAEALFTAPLPNSLQRDPDLADAYRTQLEDRAAVLERNAESAYRKAYDEARRSGVTNEWTQKILEGLNKFAPSEFPIQKRGKPAIQNDFISGNGLDLVHVDQQELKPSFAVQGR